MRRLEQACGKVECRVTQGPGDAARFAAEMRSSDALFVLGGDGTVNEILNAVAIDGPALGLLPAGTGNVLAKEHGIPRDPERAVQALLDGRMVRADLGVA